MRIVARSLPWVLGALLVALGQAPAQSDDLVARGRYLVEMAGKCSDCHGPKLTGMKLGFINPALPPIVRRAAPRIAGLPQLTQAQAVRFLHSGLLPGGKPARPPMPEYRFSTADATAIAAYLKSLP